MDPNSRKVSDLLKEETEETSTIEDEFSCHEKVPSLTEPIHIGRWHGLVKIELMDNKICELPQSPDCPKLRELLLQDNIELMDIPHSFFNHMPLLQYLDLSNTSIRDLPPSISKLTELMDFFLRNCELLAELPPIIGKLKNLRVLDLDETFITHLPEEIGELINLQRLILCFDQDLCYGSSPTIIPPRVIPNLTQLNCLSINVDPEDERWNENVTHVLVEILELERLETVNIYVPRAELLEFIPPSKSFNFRLVVGHHKRRFISRVTPQAERKFKHCGCSIKFVNGVNVPDGVKMNLQHSRALYLDRHMTIKSLTDFELKNLHRLQICILAECNEMKTIVDGSYSHYDGLALPDLECLLVFYMKNLRSICEGSKLHFLSFCHLKYVALHTCPMLTTIFTLDSLNNLPILEELIVEDCPKVTTLVSHNSLEHETRSFLPRLRMILLLYLPELVNIFNGLHVGEGLRQIGIYSCPKLQSLSKLELSNKSVKIIYGESKWWETLQWNAAEWGDIGRPNFHDLIFFPIDEETDIMTQLLACHEDDNKFQRKRRSLLGPRPPNIIVNKESQKRKSMTVESNSRKTALFYTVSPTVIHVSPTEFRNVVQSLTGIDASVTKVPTLEETGSSEKEMSTMSEDVEKLTISGTHHRHSGRSATGTSLASAGRAFCEAYREDVSATRLPSDITAETQSDGYLR